MTMTTTTIRMVACAALAIGALAGCEKSDKTEPSGGSAAAPAASPSATPSAAAPSATPPTPSETASTAAPAPSATPDSATAAAQSAAQSAQSAAQTAAKTESPTTAPSGAAASPEVAQAQTLLDQTVQYIKENKMDLADKSLTQLEALKPKLPVAYQSKIDSARKAFNAAKSGQGLKLDSVLPGAAK